jgi:hypothetical protein
MRSIFAALVLIFGSFFLSPPGVEAGGAVYREGEILVQFREGTPPGIIHNAHGSVQGKIRRNLPERVQLITLPPHVPAHKALGIYRANPRVKHAEPNYVVRRAVTPNDPQFRQQWHLYNTGQRYLNSMPRGTVGADIGAPEAWALHTGSDQIIVAILDSGIDYLHPDLVSNVMGGWNFVSGDDDPMDDDSSSHGTHVAGIIGAVGNNGIGVSGVNWKVKLMSLKTLGANGSGTVADAIEAIDYATRMGARVINASYGYPGDCKSVAPSEFERQAIERAGAAGVLFVAAAGNSSCDNDVTPFYPAGYPLSNVVAVAATDAHDKLAPFSNYGATSVHIAAPGHPVLSTLHRERGNYGFLSGTSMAAPMVSGAAALLMSYNPALSTLEVRRLLLETSSALPAIYGKAVFGRLDAGEALRVAYFPFAPTNFRIFSNSGEASLEWDYFGNEEFIDLERREGSEDFELLATLPAGALGYRDTNFPNTEGSVFSYRVRVRTGTDSSPWSPETGFGIPPIAPENLQADIDQDGVLLSWEDHSQVETGYEIERRSAGGDFQSIATLPEDSIEHFDEEVLPGTTYSYRVRALNGLTGPSNYSEQVALTFPDVSNASVNSGSSAAGRGGGGCFIATAAFGSEFHPRVAALRQFRDEALLPRWWGRLFNELYLRLSPPLARQVEKSDAFRSFVRSALVPVFWAVEWWMEMQGEEDNFNRSQLEPFAASGK